MKESQSTDKVTQGKRFAEERKRCGVSQLDFAERLGTVREVIGRYERGVHGVSSEALALLAKLGGDPMYVLLGVKEDSPTEEVLSSDEYSLIRMYRSLPDKDKTRIRHYADAFALRALEEGNSKTFMKRPG